MKRGIQAALVMVAAATGVRADERPNILFIMSDDHTWQGLGCYGGPLAALDPTPTLDRLASEGMVFDSALCTNSICTPSRACIMTGQYAHTNGVLTLNERLPPERQLLAHAMGRAGYQTAVIGKWHLKDRPEAFDYYKVLPGQGSYFDPTFFEKGRSEAVRTTGHSTDRITDAALAWFEERREGDRPFLLMLHYKAPHDYFEYAPRYEEYLADVDIPEPPTLWHRGEGSIATRGHEGELSRVIATSIGRRNTRRSYASDFEVDRSLSDDEAKRSAYNTYLKKYLRCVKGVDDNVARVLACLDERGLRDNTVVMYTGDQGFFLGEHDMQDKRWAYEPCARMPLLVRYPPTVPAGGRCGSLVENVDFPATMVDLAGAETPAEMQGRSFRPMLEGGPEPDGWRKESYYQYWMHMAHHDVPAHVAMRTARHKLIFFYGTSGTARYRSERSRYPTPPGWELYDLREDPTESRNLYDDPDRAELVADLKGRFRELRRRVRADDPSVAPDEASRATIASSNAVIDDFWDDTEDDRRRAREISRAYLQRFADRDR